MSTGGFSFAATSALLLGVSTKDDTRRIRVVEAAAAVAAPGVGTAAGDGAAAADIAAGPAASAASGIAGGGDLDVATGVAVTPTMAGGGAVGDAGMAASLSAPLPDVDRGTASAEMLGGAGEPANDPPSGGVTAMSTSIFISAPADDGPAAVTSAALGCGCGLATFVGLLRHMAFSGEVPGAGDDAAYTAAAEATVAADAPLGFFAALAASVVDPGRLWPLVVRSCVCCKDISAGAAKAGLSSAMALSSTVGDFFALDFGGRPRPRPLKPNSART